MAIKKRRSDIAKLVTMARDIWRFSENYQQVKRTSRNPDKPGWFVCRKCAKDVEVIRIDHLKALGEQPNSFKEFGDWLNKLFCPITNLQPICNFCHREKTKEDARILKLNREKNLTAMNRRLTT